MELTMQTTGKAQYRDKLKILVTGPSGSGKTRFAATAPNVLFAEAQAGLMSVAEKQLPFVTLKCEQDLLALRLLLDVDDAQREETFGRPIDTLVLDTGDEFGRILLAERLRDQRRGEANGSDYGWVGQRLHTIFERLVELPIHVIILCHARELSKDDDVRILKPGFAGQFSDQMLQYFDYSFLSVARTWKASEDGPTDKTVPEIGSTRFLRSWCDQTADFLLDRSGQLPPEFELDFETDFERIQLLVSRFEELPEGTSTQIVVPDDDRLDRKPAPPRRTATPVPPTATPAPVVLPTAVETATAHQITPYAEYPHVLMNPTVEPTWAEETKTEATPTPEEDPFLPAAHPPVESEATPADTSSTASETDLGNGKCKDCSKFVESDDQYVMSNIRFREPLCGSCMATRRSNEES